MSIEALWANPAVQAVAWALVHFLWQGALVGIAAAGALTLLKNGSASLRYSVALGALLVLLLCPVGTALWMAGAGGEQPLAREAVPAVVVAGAPVQVPDVPVLSSNARDLLPAALPWFFAVWLAGVAVLSVYHLGGWSQARRWTRRATRPLPEDWQAKLRVLARRLGIGREVGLLESASAQVPSVIGWLRPVILVPAGALAGLSPQQLEAVLAHELAHVRRHDYLVNLLQTVVETLLFYHPAVWWVSAQARRERENCCDDLAVAVCGDRLVYARALADLEGLRVSSPRLAMAADGGSLAARIRRLAGVPARDSRRSWLAGVLALSLLPAGFAFNVSASADKAEKKDEGHPRNGTWTLEKKTGDLFKIKMEMRWPGSHWISNTEIQASELKGLTTGSNVRFEMPRDAGTFHFQGGFDGNRGKGTLTFQGNPEYARQMRSLGYEVSDSRLLELYVHDISLDLARAMTALGKISTDKLVELRIHNVSPEYIREMADLGYRGLSADKLVEFKIHGVSPALVRALVDTGYADLPPGRVVEFQIHGVTPDYIRGLAKAGYRDVEPKRLVEMKIHGITPAYVQGVVDAGYRDLPPSKLVEFKIHGIDGKFIRDAASRGYKNLSPGELVDLKIQGRLDRRREG